MASKYFTGTGVWNAAGANWGAAPGGPYNTTFDAGDDAIFEGAPGVVTVSAPNNPRHISFSVSGFDLSGGTITQSAQMSITVPAGMTAAISAVLAGGFAVWKLGDGSLTLSGANTYLGKTEIQDGAILATNNDSFGPAKLGNNLGVVVKNSGQVRISGGISIDQNLADETTYPHPCLVSLSGNNVWSGPISKNGGMAFKCDSDLLTFSANPYFDPVQGPWHMAYLGAGNITVLGNMIGGTALFKGLGAGDTGTLRLHGTNSTNVDSTVAYGALLINGFGSAGSASINVGSGATLGGTGTIRNPGGAGIVNGGILAPGDGGPGTLTFTNEAFLTLSNLSILRFCLGTISDKVIGL